jgi:hypothetical protein
MTTEISGKSGTNNTKSKSKNVDDKKPVGDGNGNTQEKKEGWIVFLSKNITKAALDATLCGLACAVFVPIQRTVMGQPIIMSDVVKIAMTCAGRAGIVSPFKKFVKSGIHVDPKRKDNIKNNPNVTKEYDMGKTDFGLQFLKDSFETAIITAIEAAPGTYQDSITAKNVDLPMIVGLTIAKSIPGNFMDTKTYKDKDDVKDEGYTDTVTSMSRQAHYNNRIEKNRGFFQFAKNTADSFSLAYWVNRGIDAVLPAKDKKQEFNKAIFKDNIHNKKSFGDYTLAKNVFVEGVTWKDLLDRGIVKENIAINSLKPDVLVKDILDNKILASQGFGDKILAIDIFNDNAIKHDIVAKETGIKQDIVAKEKLSKDITEYLMTGVAAFVSTVPATMLSNAPLTPANFAKTFALRFISIGLWSGALNIAGKIHSIMWESNKNTDNEKPIDNPPPADIKKPKLQRRNSI